MYFSRKRLPSQRLCARADRVSQTSGNATASAFATATTSRRDADRRSAPRRRLLRIESLEDRTLLSASAIDPLDILDDDWSLETTPYIDVGPSDNVCWDQPQVAVELLVDLGNDNWGSVGPDMFNTWLLDTGANTTIAFSSAVDGMVGPSYPYETEGTFEEIGVGGVHEFDISAAYRFDFAGDSGIRNTLLNERIISDPDNDVSMFGPFGIVGMPAMTNRVTTFDFTVWKDLTSWSMREDFSDELPPDDGNRYSIPVDKRITFDPEEQVVGDAETPMWADIPFLTAVPVHNGVAAAGSFVYDTGAQLSIMSTRVAMAMGLDSNEDGVLDEYDAQFLRNETVGGVGGTKTIPTFLFDEVHIPTEQGVDLVWTDLQWVVLDIAPGIDGVIGFDLMTSGWIEAFAAPGESGFINQVQLDFTQWETVETGFVHIDLNPDYNMVIDPGGPGAELFETGGSTTVSESGVDDTYQIVLTQAPAANVTIQLQAGSSTAPAQLMAVDDVNPGNDFLTFTPTNWNVPQTVRVSAVNDALLESYHHNFIRHISTSTDPDFQDIGMPRMIVTIIDDDYPGFMIISSGEGTEIVEGGSTDTYQIVLMTPPTLDVKILMEHEQGQLTVVDAAATQNSFLTFTSENWDVPQTVLVTAVDDAVVEGTHIAYISHFFNTVDEDYLLAFAQQEFVTIREEEALPPVRLDNGTLMIEGTELDDSVIVTSLGTDQVRVTVPSLGVMGELFSGVARIDIKTFGGDDTIRIDGLAIPVTADGGPGHDHLYGGSGDDLLIGGLGNDWLYGKGGDDTLLGGDGYDYLDGGSGNDFIDGGIGNDRLYGQSGDNVLLGGGDDDRLFGGIGADLLDGGLGADYIDGSLGDDQLFGGPGDDYLSGSFGNDTLFGGADNDRLYGSFGDDTLYGEAGTNQLFGSFGADTLVDDSATSYLNPGSDDVPDVDTILTELDLPKSVHDTAIDQWSAFWQLYTELNDHDDERETAISIDASYIELVDRLFGGG